MVSLTDDGEGSRIYTFVQSFILFLFINFQFIVSLIDDGVDSHVYSPTVPFIRLFMLLFRA